MSLTAVHPRTREHFMALYEICLGKSATQVGKDSRRNPQTIMDWGHRYNNHGPDALKFRHTGAHPPRWTLKRLQKWLEEKWGVSSSRETVLKALRGLGFSWKKGRKLLNKANPKKRGEFFEKLEDLFEETIKTGRLLVYIDEAHIYLDTLIFI